MKGWLAAVVFVFCSTVAWGHDTEIMQCSQLKHLAKITEWILPNGMIAEAYDRNGDGKHDVVALSAVKAVKKTDGSIEYTHAVHPTFYLVDVDFDDTPDVVYVDKNGTGHCADIVLYEDLRDPRGPGKEATPNKGRGL